MGTLWSVFFVLQIPMYSVCILADFVRILAANFPAASLSHSGMSHMALIHFAKTLVAMLRLFKASSMVSVLTLINSLVLTSVVSKEIMMKTLSGSHYRK